MKCEVGKTGEFKQGKWVEYTAVRIIPEGDDKEHPAFHQTHRLNEDVGPLKCPMCRSIIDMHEFKLTIADVGDLINEDDKIWSINKPVTCECGHSFFPSVKIPVKPYSKLIKFYKRYNKL